MFSQYARLVLLSVVMGVLPLERAEAAETTSCDGEAEEIIRNAYPDATKSGDETFTVGGSAISVNDSEVAVDAPQVMRCRVWSANPQLTLVAVPLMTSMNEDGNEGDLDLLVVETATSAVKHRLRLENRMNDDALRISAVEFDTARYRLAKDQTAFGLRISTSGSSRPNPYSDVSLWLFTLENGALRPVLDGMIVSKNTGEWDTNCAGEFQSVQTTLSIGQTASQGHLDIIATETGSTTTSALGKDGDCNDTVVTSKPQKLKLVYNGQQYPIPEDRRAITE
ncbi:hypothetical protein HRR99_03560 [Agrobacterium vaccinii]|uniref:hypothetical protein n=1 Tax=Agrobacterium vaccinii TaxID=2735528 RepID=UPI001E612FA0|nr:hypothetical protein [Agrobacterium vaccinii]UHS60660.1 hypothetical protein HRR99_03560 [Agrobacterium vaccinii]